MSRNVLSLFSSAGIGELGIKAKDGLFLSAMKLLKIDVSFIVRIIQMLIIYVAIFGKRKMRLLSIGKKKQRNRHSLSMQLHLAKECHLMGQEKYYERFVMERGNQKIHVID